jgi:hypothetical protein
MLSKVKIIGSVLIFFISTSCTASGESMKKNGETVIIKGTVRVVGNEPFPRLVLTVKNTEGGKIQQDYVIKGHLAKKIWDQYQGQVIVIEGKYCAESVPEHLLCIEPERIVGVE